MAIRSILVVISASLAAMCAAVSQARPADDAERIWLEAHNEARAEFGSSALKWSDSLARDAAEWAQVLARKQQMQHASLSQRKGQGENLWMGTRGYFAPRQMIDSFVSERQHFVSGQFPKVSRTGRWGDVGHYTQIVWPETRQVGCAIASGAQFDVLVCRYYPAGNMIGAYIAPKERVAKR
ncbi:MAG: CAP domain-containing protein [Pseudomonadota bacterium]|nr:CAP domain-containing protein [Pseudomonadota bacterium]